jgi:hypothetical protein
MRIKIFNLKTYAQYPGTRAVEPGFVQSQANKFWFSSAQRYIRNLLRIRISSQYSKASNGIGDSQRPAILTLQTRIDGQNIHNDQTQMPEIRFMQNQMKKQ